MELATLRSAISSLGSPSGRSRFLLHLAHEDGWETGTRGLWWSLVLEVTGTLNFSIVFWVADFVVAVSPLPITYSLNSLRKEKIQMLRKPVGSLGL